MIIMIMWMRRGDEDDDDHSDGDDWGVQSHGPYSPCTAPDGDADDVGQRSRIPDLGIADDMPSTGARREVHDDADTIHE